MGILDGIKGIGNSVGVVYNLCNKSWLQIDDSGERITYVFKPNNQLYLTINGASQIVPWKYFPENERIVIYYKNNEGRSFRHSFIEKGVLLTLKDEQTGNIIVLANEGANNAPKAVLDLGRFFMKRNASLIGAVIGDKVSTKIKDEAYNRQVALTLDTVLDGCDASMLVEHVNYFKQNVPGFNVYYRNYINYRKYKEDLEKRVSDDSFPSLDFTVSIVDNLIYPMCSSKCLDNYLACVGERIEYDGIIQRLIQTEKASQEFKEKWGLD